MKWETYTCYLRDNSWNKMLLKCLLMASKLSTRYRRTVLHNNCPVFMCLLVKARASELFDPFQFAVACPLGSEKVVHGIRNCVEQHWGAADFAILKVDLIGFSLMNVPFVSLPFFLGHTGQWYGVYPPMAPYGSPTFWIWSSAGWPIGTSTFALVLHKVINAI